MLRIVTLTKTNCQMAMSIKKYLWKHSHLLLLKIIFQLLKTIKTEAEQLLVGKKIRKAGILKAKPIHEKYLRAYSRPHAYISSN